MSGPVTVLARSRTRNQDTRETDQSSRVSVLRQLEESSKFNTVRSSPDPIILGSKTCDQSSAKLPGPVRSSVVEHQVKRQEISEDQSFGLVKQLLLRLFSALCYWRKILPHEVFSFGWNDSSQGATIGARPRTPFPPPVLRKGVSPRADKLLAWLSGVDDALQRHFLAATQVSVILDKNKPSNVIETHTFSIDYILNENTGERQICGIGTSENKVDVTIRDAQRELEWLIVKFSESMDKLPSLPINSFLTVHLFYTDECPNNYQPPGFVECKTDTILVPENDRWAIKAQRVGQVDFGFHQVTVKLSSLPGGPTTTIPSRINCNKCVQRLTKDEYDQQEHGNREQQSETTDTESAKEQLTPGEELQSSREGNSHALNESELPNEMESEAQMGRRLEEMAKSQSTQHDQIKTQLIDKPNQAPKAHMVWALREDTAAAISKRKQSDTEASLLRTPGNCHPIRCACGSSQEEGQMIQCKSCHLLQHEHCHSLKEGCTLKRHMCYQCLLGEREGPLLDQMKKIASLRRALWILRKEGFPISKAAFEKRLEYNKRRSNELIGYLKNEGFLIDTPKSQDKRKQPPFQVAITSSNPGLSHHRIFDPLFLIGHHYAACQHNAHASKLTAGRSHRVETPGAESPHPTEPSSETVLELCRDSETDNDIEGDKELTDVPRIASCESQDRPISVGRYRPVPPDNAITSVDKTVDDQALASSNEGRGQRLKRRLPAGSQKMSISKRMRCGRNLRSPM